MAKKPPLKIYKLNLEKMKDSLIIISIFIAVWIPLTLLTYKLFQSIVSILVFTLCIAGLLLICLYSPIKAEMDNEIDASKNQYTKYKKSIDTFYEDQIKTTWTTAVNGRNKYFILFFIILLYTPIPIYMVYLARQNETRDTFFDTWMGRATIIALNISVLATTIFGIIAMGSSMWYILIPAILAVPSAAYVLI